MRSLTLRILVSALVTVLCPACAPGPSRCPDAVAVPSLSPPDTAPTAEPEPISATPGPRPCAIAAAHGGVDGSGADDVEVALTEDGVHTATLHVPAAGARNTLSWDADGRLRQAGDDVVWLYQPEHVLAVKLSQGTTHVTQLTLDERGRVRTRRTPGDDTITYEYGDDGSRNVTWSYPDSEEYCEPDRGPQVRDARGRLTEESWEGCGIYYRTPYRTTYHYEGDRLARAEIQVGVGSETPATVTVTYEYSCAGAEPAR